MAKHLEKTEKLAPKKTVYRKRHASIDNFVKPNSQKDLDIIEKARLRMEKKMQK